MWSNIEFEDQLFPPWLIECGNVPGEEVVDLRDSLSRLSCVDVWIRRRYVFFPYSKIVSSSWNPFSVLNATSFVIYLFTKRQGIYSLLNAKFINLWPLSIQWSLSSEFKWAIKRHLLSRTHFKHCLISSTFCSTRFNMSRDIWPQNGGWVMNPAPAERCGIHATVSCARAVKKYAPRAQRGKRVHTRAKPVCFQNIAIPTLSTKVATGEYNS